MADESTFVNSDIGHLGVVKYDRSSEEWITNRTFDNSGTLESVGPLERYLSGQLPDYQETEDPHQLLSTQAGLRQVAIARPEIQPACRITCDDTPRVSLKDEFLQRMPEHLIAIGEAQCLQEDPETSIPERRGSMRVLAIPTGSFVDRIAVIELRSHKLTTNYNLKRHLKAFSLKDSVNAIWRGNGSSVHQITFNINSDQSSVLLAVLTSTSIAILRPVFSYGRLQIKELLSLPTSPAFGFACSHVAFHPKRPRQLAAIGTRGEFFIWNIHESTVNFRGYKYSFVASDRSLYLPVNPANPILHFRENGWRKILWVLDDRTVILCSPTNLECWDSMNSTPLGLWDHRNIQQPSRILDVKVLEQKHSDIVILTTTEVILLRVHRYGDHANFRPLLRWIHRRDGTDFRLRFALVEQRKGFNLVLFSTQHNLVTSVSFKFDKQRIICRDENLLKCHGSGVFSIQPLMLSKDRRKASAVFWQLFFLQKDLSLLGCVCCLHYDSSRNIAIEVPPLIRSLSPPLDEENLVLKANEGDQEESESGIDLPSSPRSSFHEIVDGTLISALRTTFTVPRQMVYRNITESALSDPRNGYNTWEELLTDVAYRNRSQDTKLKILASSTSLTFPADNRRATPIAIPQITEIMNKKPRTDAGYWQVHQIARAEPLGISQLGLTISRNSTIDAIYRQLLWIYNRPLRSSIRGTQRLRKESSARQAAILVFLASIGITHIRTTAQNVHSQQLPSSVAVELSSSMDKSESTGANAVLQSMSRLSKFAEIAQAPSSDGPQLQSSNAGISQVLAHWDVNLEPSEYSYEATHAILTGESTVEGSAMSAADRDRATRREMRARERLVARQARLSASKLREEDTERNDIGTKRKRLEGGFDESYPDFRSTGSQMSNSQSQQQKMKEPRAQSPGFSSQPSVIGHPSDPDRIPRPKLHTNTRIPERSRRIQKQPGF